MSDPKVGTTENQTGCRSFFICLFVLLCLFGKGSGNRGEAGRGSSYFHNKDQAFYSHLNIWMSCRFQHRVWLLNNVRAGDVGTWNARVTSDQIEFIQHVMSRGASSSLKLRCTTNMLYYNLEQTSLPSSEKSRVTQREGPKAPFIHPWFVRGEGDSALFLGGTITLYFHFDRTVWYLSFGSRVTSMTNWKYLVKISTRFWPFNFLLSVHFNLSGTYDWLVVALNRLSTNHK